MRGAVPGMANARTPKPKFRLPGHIVTAARLQRVAPRRESHKLTLWLQGSGGVPRRLDIPLLAIGAALLVVAVTVFGSIEYGIRSHMRTLALQSQAEKLSAEAIAGAQAQNQLSQLQQQAASLQSTLTSIQQLDGKIKAAAGAPNGSATAGLSTADTAVSHLDAASGVLRQLQQAIPALTQDVQSLDQSMTDWTTQAAHTPSIWPVQGPITSPYGARTDPFNEGTGEFHTGVDIGVPSGTPVHATVAGTVLFAGWNNIYGNQVIVSAGGGLDTMYGHNEQLLVHAGQQVNKGEVVALSGSTGWSTGPHVHYEVDQNGQPVSPDAFLPGYRDVASGGGASNVGSSNAGNFGYGGR